MGDEPLKRATQLRNTWVDDGYLVTTSRYTWTENGEKKVEFATAIHKPSDPEAKFKKVYHKDEAEALKQHEEIVKRCQEDLEGFLNEE